MYKSLLFLFLFCLRVDLQLPSHYVKFYIQFKSPGSLADVYEDPINKLYQFGLTRLFFGTKIMPFQREIYFQDNIQQQFWQLVKIWILKSSDLKQADTTFNNVFLPEVEKYYCIGWSCCNNSANCQTPGNNPKNGDIVIELLGEQQYAMPFRFLVIWCQIAWEIYYRDKANNWDTEIVYRNIKAFCPNSCKSNPCSTKLGVDNPTDCKVNGLYVDQYECHCSSGMKWDIDALICLNLNPCDQSTFTSCDIDGTDECVNTGNLGFTCICKEHRMGFDCTQERNACLESFYSHEKVGNYYCNVRFANKCIPSLGSNFYQCECTDQYTVDTSIPQDNCLKQVDSCDLLVCLNGGICTTSPDQTTSVCICQTNRQGYPIFHGFFCETPNGIWSEWSSWSSCRPNCGESLYRLRKRFCLNDTLECEGFNEEIMSCPELKPCKNLVLSGMKKSDMIDYSGLIVIAILVALQMAGSFFLAQFLILNRKIIFPFIVKHVFTPIYRLFKK